MRTLVITGASPEMHPLLDATLPSKQAWTSLHGYDLKVIREWKPDALYGFGGRIGFLRVLSVFDSLREYDSCMWIDGDAFITNLRFRIESFLSDAAIFSASFDWTETSRFSSGNFVIRKGGRLQELMDEFIIYGHKYIDHPECDQWALNEIAIDPKFSELFSILPRRFLNSVPTEVKKYWKTEKREIAEPWTPASFLAHLTCASHEDRLRVVQTYSEWKNSY